MYDFFSYSEILDRRLQCMETIESMASMNLHMCYKVRRILQDPNRTCESFSTVQG